MRSLTCGALIAATAGCGDTFTPETWVDGLRVLGIRADPPELHPGATATLSALVVNPSAPVARQTLLWLACDPDPYDLGRNACSEFGNLADPTELFRARTDGSSQLPPGVRFAGFGESASYTAPASLFSVLPLEDRRRLSGSVAQVLLFAVAEEISPFATRAEIDGLLERVRSRQVASVVSLFRIRVTEQSPLNSNPILGELLVHGLPVPEGAHVALRPAEQAPISCTAPDHIFESYEQVLPQGSESRTERLIAALYATGGLFSQERVAIGEDVESLYTAPSRDEHDLPQPGHRRMWIVVRDTRGGQVWRELPLHLCEPPGGAPSVAQVTPSEVVAFEERLIGLEGSQLEFAVDVFVGSAALQGGMWSEENGRFEGTLSGLGPGDYPVRIRMRDCTEHDTGHLIRVR